MRRRRKHCPHLERGLCDLCRVASRRAAGRRAAQRERGERDADLARRNATATTCQYRCRWTRCGSPLAPDVDLLGRTILRCELCERRRKGICRDCPARVAGKVGQSLRCTRCRRRAIRASIRRYNARNHEEKLAKAREWYQNNPERRARRNEYKRLYRKAHPEKVRAQKRREALRQGKHRLQWHRRYNRKKSRIKEKRQQALARYYELHPERPVARCRACSRYIDWTPGPRKGRPPVRCDDCVWACEKRRRNALGHFYPPLDSPPVGEWVPVIPKRKPRTCLTPGCPTIVSGRTKKCGRCRTIELELAQQLLAAHQGRGRRTDLEHVA